MSTLLSSYHYGIIFIVAALNARRLQPLSLMTKFIQRCLLTLAKISRILTAIIWAHWNNYQLSDLLPSPFWLSKALINSITVVSSASTIGETLGSNPISTSPNFNEELWLFDSNLWSFLQQTYRLKIMGHVWLDLKWVGQNYLACLCFELLAHLRSFWLFINSRKLQRYDL